MQESGGRSGRVLLALALYLALQSVLGLGLSAALPELPPGVLYLPLLGSGALVWGIAQGVHTPRRAALGSAILALIAATLAAAVWTGESPAGFYLPPLAFGWALAASLLGGGGAWATARQGRIWEIVIGEAVLLTATGAAAGGGLLTMGVFLGASVLFLLGETHIRREREWEARGVDYATDLRLDTALTALGLSVLLTAAALTFSIPAPRPAWRALAPLTDPLRARIQRINRAAGLHPAAEAAGEGAEGTFAFAQPAGLPRQYLLGSGPELAEIPVASIRLQIPAAPPPLPLYWRSGTYDRYTGQGWTRSGGETVPWRNPDRLPEGENLVWQEVRYLRGEPPFPVLALGTVRYLDGRAQALTQPPETAYALHTPADAYRVWSAPPLATPAQLRAAPRQYPAWVRERYLVLPEGTPSRLKTLALALAREAETPYDKALALEAYLRTFPYALDLPPPPADRDLTAYFLFELRRGYCDYYATAFAVLGRAAGLPTRLATGYLGGACDPSTRTCTLYAGDGHSWPEVYFPGYGWVPFEPTAGRTAPARSEAETNLPPAPAPAVSRGFSPPRGAGGILLALMLLTGGAGVLRALGETLALRRLPPRERILRLWERAVRRAERDAAPPPKGATPLEIGRQLKGSLAPLARLPRGDVLLQDAVACTDAFIHLVNLAWFAPHAPQESRLALSHWRKLRLYLLAARNLERGRRWTGGKIG